LTNRGKVKPENGLKFSNLTETTVDLTWKPSKSDGGTPITNYTIEIKESRRKEKNVQQINEDSMKQCHCYLKDF
jgi:hypothetical protein